MKNVSMHKALFSIADYFRGDRGLSKLKLLKKSQYWSGEELKKWQLEKMSALLAHARANSPFYGKRLSGMRLPLKDIRQIEEIPVLTKKDIRENAGAIKCRNISEKRLVPANTGGSTGEPMRYFSDRVALGWRRALVLRSGEWAGIGLGEKNIQMTGSHYEYTKQKNAINRMKLWLVNGKGMSVAYVNDSVWNDYLKEVIRWKPASIWGYAGAIYSFARFIEADKPGEDFSYIKAIITSSETLQPYQREVINKVFGHGKVFDHYGSSEFYAAAECRYHNGYHINEDTLKLEIVDGSGKTKAPGETGRVILTDYYNYAFPFIRYEIGDVGALADPKGCPCGVRLPKLEKLEGRIADMIVLPDRMLTAPNFTNIFRPLEGVEEYQILQSSASDIVVNIVRNSNFNSDNERHIRYSLEKILGSVNKYKINYVEYIDVPRSGKRRYVISEVAGRAL